MKKLIALCAIASVTTAFAADDNVFGCLRVDSSAPETIVAVPWVAAGVSADEIKVADIVKTANLTEGDELWWYNGSSYLAWKLEGGVWTGMQIVAGNGKPPAAAGDNQVLARGNAILLIRQDSSKPFYLYGQVATTPAGTMTMGLGTATAPCYTLIAPPSVEDTMINNITWANVGENDLITISGADPLRYNGETWGNWKIGADWTKTWQASEAVIKAGQGAWYISFGGKDSGATATWPTAN